MKYIVILGLALTSVLILFLTTQPAITTSQLNPSAAPSGQSPDSSEPAAENFAAATASQSETAVKEIHIKLGNFFFDGPDGRSGSESKSPTTIEPQVVVRLKNGEPVKLIFENTSNIVVHEVISPLFSSPEEKRFTVPPLGKVEIELAPNFLTAEDGGTLTFHLVCHVRHGQTTDHYKLGMHGLIEIVPND